MKCMLIFLSLSSCAILSGASNCEMTIIKHWIDLVPFINKAVAYRETCSGRGILEESDPSDSFTHEYYGVFRLKLEPSTKKIHVCVVTYLENIKLSSITITDPNEYFKRGTLAVRIITKTESEQLKEAMIADLKKID